MKTQIAFMFEGVKYFTFYGSNYMAGTFPDTNVVTLNDVTKSKAVQGELRKLNGGINWNMTPTLINEHLSRVGKYIQGTGDVVVDGVTYHVEFSPNGMDWKSDDSVDEKAVPELTNKSDVEETTSVEDDGVSDVMDVDVAETPNKGATDVENHDDVKPTYSVPENTNAKGTLTLTSGKTNEVSAQIEPLSMESGKTTFMKAAIAQLPDNLGVLDIKPNEPLYVNTERWGANKGNRAKLGLTIGTSTTSEGLVFHGNMPCPNTSEGFRNRRLRSTSVTGRPTGMSFGRQNTYVRYPDTHLENEAVTKLKQTVSVPVSSVKDEEKEREEALMRSWQNTQKVDTSARWEQPVVETVAEETVDVKAVTDVDAEKRKAAKEAVRATLPPEINAVIGDIPVEMLTSIAEFTSSPIDEKLLDEQGDLFCIDRRWHKQGKWFCIDVVCNTSRYFFNSRLGVSIEIPISFCKAWYDAVM